MTSISRRILLDRYAQKTFDKDSLEIGQEVIFVANKETGLRDIGVIKSISDKQVCIETEDRYVTWENKSEIDIPIELKEEEIWLRVAKGIASHEKTEEKRKEWEEKFYSILNNWDFVPGGRILTKAGTDQKLSNFNCFVIPMPYDSRQGIIKTLGRMVEIMSRGGGVGFNVSTLRPRFAKVVGVNGRSSGSVSWADLYSFVTNLVEQAGSRRGALLMCLNIWHPDVEEFIGVKKNPNKINFANISVGISDKFMDAVKNNLDWNLEFPDTEFEKYNSEWDGDLDSWKSKNYPVIIYKTVKAKELWNSICESAWSCAEPGLLFIDRYNKMSNSDYYSKIWSTNPCVSENSLVSTSKGLVKAKNVKKGDLIYTVYGLRPVEEIEINEDIDVYRVYAGNGMYIDVTQGHRFHSRTENTKCWKETELKNLKIGDTLKLNKMFMPSNHIKYADTLRLTQKEYGFIIGVILEKQNNDALLENEDFEFKNCFKHKLTLDFSEIINSNIALLSGFLDGLFSSKGNFVLSPDGCFVNMYLTDVKILQNINRVLLMFGINSKITEFNKTMFELCISGNSLKIFLENIEITQNKKRLIVKEILKYGFFNDDKWETKIKEIKYLGKQTTYDFFESDSDTYIVDGFVSQGCGEQGLPANGVCNLGAINLSNFVCKETRRFLYEKLDMVVRIAIRFLDNVIDDSYYFEENHEKQQKSERRLGLGIMGLADALIQMKIKYGSEESLQVVENIFKLMRDSAYDESSNIAKEKGKFSRFDFEQYSKSGFFKELPKPVQEKIERQGIRNVTLLTIAPTGSTGSMVETSTGIEPFFEFEFWRNSRIGRVKIREKVYQDWLDSQDENETSLGTPDYFVTASNLTPKEHVAVMAAAQKYVDSSISKTVNCPEEYTVEQVGEIYTLMYELGCKGGTVYRDNSRREQVLEKIEDKKEQKNEKPVLDYPSVREGKTYSIDTPVGRAHITINDYKESPIECFVEVGKAGSDLQSFSEALGRLISLVFRLRSDVAGVERVNHVVSQLEGIGGARSTGFGEKKVLSLPDAVAKILKAHYEGKEISELKKEPANVGDLCPSCGNSTFVRSEGCHSCLDCGYSQC